MPGNRCFGVAQQRARPAGPAGLALLCIALCLGCGAFRGAQALDATGQPPLRVAAMVERLARQHRVCDVAYATVLNGAVGEVGSAKGCGGTAPAPAAASIFQAASLSKTVFAYGVLKLVEHGRLALDTPLVAYLPNGYVHRQNPFDADSPARSERVTAPGLAAVTARMVLNHTSGLPNWSVGTLAFDFKPGTAWQYSGEGFMLLQRVVEAVTGQTLDAAMRAQVFDPLGMRNSHFRWDPGFDERLVAGASSAGKRQPVRFMQPVAAASLYTTAQDYALFLAALLDDAAVLRLTLTNPVSVEPKIGLWWGLGWAIEQASAVDGPLIWQWGNNPGYRAFAMASTASRTGFVILTNSEQGLALAEPLAAALLPGQHPIFGFRMLR